MIGVKLTGIALALARKTVPAVPGILQIGTSVLSISSIMSFLQVSQEIRMNFYAIFDYVRIPVQHEYLSFYNHLLYRENNLFKQINCTLAIVQYATYGIALSRCAPTPAMIMATLNVARFSYTTQLMIHKHKRCPMLG